MALDPKKLDELVNAADAMCARSRKMEALENSGKSYEEVAHEYERLKKERDAL